MEQVLEGKKPRSIVRVIPFLSVAEIQGWKEEEEEEKVIDYEVVLCEKGESDKLYEGDAL